MTVVLLDRTRNSSQLYQLFLAGSDLTQEVNGYYLLASLFVSLFSCLMGVMSYIYDPEKEEDIHCWLLQITLGISGAVSTNRV